MKVWALIGLLVAAPVAFAGWVCFLCAKAEGDQ